MNHCLFCGGIIDEGTLCDKCERALAEAMEQDEQEN